MPVQDTTPGLSDAYQCGAGPCVRGEGSHSIEAARCILWESFPASKGLSAISFCRPTLVASSVDWARGDASRSVYARANSCRLAHSNDQKQCAPGAGRRYCERQTWEPDPRP